MRKDKSIRRATYGIASILITLQEVWKIGSRRILVELVVLAKNNDSDIDRGQDRQLMGLFEQTTLTFQEGDGAVAIILDSLDLDFTATHSCGRKAGGLQVL